MSTFTTTPFIPTFVRYAKKQIIKKTKSRDDILAPRKWGGGGVGHGKGEKSSN